MKNLMLCFLLISQFANAYPCPTNLTDLPQAQDLHAWLSRLAGRFELSGCQIEITSCDVNQAGGDSILGEVHIVDSKGREAYVPLIYTEDPNAAVQTKIQLSKRSLHYLKVDKYYEDELGRTEAYRLEFRLDQNGEFLERLELGTYSTHKKLHRPDGSQSRWYNCGKP